MLQGVLFQPRYLRLGDADLAGHLHLRAPLEKAHAQDPLLALGQAAQRLADGQVFQPLAVRMARILDLIDDVDGVAAVVIDRLKQGYGILDGLQRQHHILLGHVQRLGDFAHAGLTVHLGHQAVARLQGFIGRIAQAAADADGVVIPQVAADFADDHRHGIGGKAHVLRHVKVIKRFDQPDAAHLKQVVRVFPAIAEALHHAEHQPEIAADKLLPRRAVAAMHQRKQLAHAFIGKHGQGGGFHPADLYLAACHTDFYLR